MPQLSLVIVNYNGKAFLPDLFESLGGQVFTDFEVLFVDNASSDGSARWVRERYAAVRIFENATNLGFSKANNLAVARARGEFVATLNTDIRLDRNWTREIIAPLERDPCVAAAASKMYLASAPAILNGVGGAMNFLGYTWDRGMFEVDRGQYDDPADVLFACAGAAAFRKSAYIAAGGFDEKYFMYHEDVDLCWRLRLLGYRVVTAPAAVVFHHFGGTSQQALGLSRREELGERHNIRTLIKHYEPNNLLKTFWRLLRLRQTPRRKFVLLKNMAWNLFWLPDTLAERRRIQRQRQKSDSEIRHLIVQCDSVPVELDGAMRTLAAGPK